MSMNIKQETSGPITTDYKTQVLRLEARGNKPNEWKDYIDSMKSRVHLVDESKHRAAIEYLYYTALKSVPDASKTSSGYASLLVDFADFKSIYDIGEAEKLFLYARRKLRRFAIVHVASAELELKRDNKEKALKILQSAQTSGSEQDESIQLALQRAVEGSFPLLGDVTKESNRGSDSSPASETSEDLNNSCLSGQIVESSYRDMFKVSLTSCQANTPEAQQGLDYLTKQCSSRRQQHSGYHSVLRTSDSIPLHQNPSFSSTLEVENRDPDCQQQSKTLQGDGYSGGLPLSKSSDLNAKTPNAPGLGSKIIEEVVIPKDHFALPMVRSIKDIKTGSDDSDKTSDGLPRKVLGTLSSHVQDVDGFSRKTFQPTPNMNGLRPYSSTPVLGSAVKGSIRKYPSRKPCPPPRRVKIDPAMALWDNEGEKTADITVSAFQPFDQDAKSRTSENVLNRPPSMEINTDTEVKRRLHNILKCEADEKVSLDLQKPSSSKAEGAKSAVAEAVCQEETAHNAAEPAFRPSELHQHYQQEDQDAGRQLQYSHQQQQHRQVQHQQQHPQEKQQEYQKAHHIQQHHQQKEQQNQKSHLYQQQQQQQQYQNSLHQQQQQHLIQQSQLVQQHIPQQQLIQPEQQHLPQQQLIQPEQQHLPQQQLIQPEQQHLPQQQLIQPEQQHLPQQQLIQPEQQHLPQQQLIQPEQQHLPQQQLIQPEQQHLPQQQLIQPDQQHLPQQQLIQSEQQHIKASAPGNPTYSVHHPPQSQAPHPYITPAKHVSQSGKKTLYVNKRPYETLRLVGRGGSAKVYQVLEPNKNQIFALKVVNLTCAQPTVVEGYKNEIALLRKLQHCDWVIKLHDWELNEDSQKLFLILEYGDTDLDKYLAHNSKNQQLLPSTVFFFWLQMVTAVNALHKEGVIHSDLKPPNFMIVAGNVKLIDFGIANAIQQDCTSMLKDNMIGTPSYMSPEMLVSNGAASSDKPKYKVGMKSDVWSLGCILYQMVYGHTPFQNIRNKLQAIIDPNHPIAFPDKDDPALTDVLKKCLERDVRLRPTTGDLLKHPYLQKVSTAPPPERAAESPQLPTSLASKLSLLESMIPTASPSSKEALGHVISRLKREGQQKM